MTYLRGFIVLEFIGLQRDLLELVGLVDRSPGPGVVLDIALYIVRTAMLDLKWQPTMLRGLLLTILRRVAKALGVLQIAYYLEWAKNW